MLLSVDFGTSNTAVAYRDALGATHAVPLSDSGPWMPSAVLYTKGRMLTVGDAAVQAASTDPSAFQASPKRHFEEPEILLAGMFVPVADLVAGVLTEAVAKAEQVMGESAGEIVLTYPDQWRPGLRQKLRRAAEVAGTDEQRVRLVSESSAAAAYFTAANDDLLVGDRLIVFDFGAGTCGVTALDKEADGSFTVVAADGIDGLGGLDLDARVQSWVMAQLTTANPALAAELSDSANTAGRMALADTVRVAKEALSEADSAQIAVSGTAGTEVLQLTRAQFEELIRPDVDRVVKFTEGIIFHAETIRSIPGQVIFHLAGGSSRIPLVQNRLADLGRIKTVDDSKAVLTEGALDAKETDPTSESGWRPSSDVPVAAPARRKRLTPLVKKWAAAIALFAIFASAIGIAAVVIFGSVTAPKPSERTAAPRTTLAPPKPSVPTPVEFTVRVVVTDSTCAPDGVCRYKYTIEPKYIGLHPLPETPFTVYYEVVGGNAPQPGEFTVEKDQAKILKDVIIEGKPGAQLTANVMRVTG